jgi:excisionase family DNA binding protein
MREYERMVKNCNELVLLIKDDIPERPLTPSELAQWVGTSRRFIESQVRLGKLRARRISPRAVRFLRSDIAAWLSSSSTTGVDA